MADNIAITPGSGATVRTDDVGGVQEQVVKLALGADGVEDCLVDSGQQLMANSVPVVLASNHSDVKVTLDGETVVLGAGSAAVGKLAANDGVDIGDVTINNPAGGAVYVQPGTGATFAVNDGSGSLTVDGSVTIGTALPAGANNIGDVDVVTVPADPFGANADAAITSDTTGSMQGKLRGLVKWAFERMPASLGQKTKTGSLPVCLASDQDALPVTDNAGSLTVDNAGSFAVQDSQVLTDNGGFTDGTSKLFAAGYILDETAGTALTENDAAAARVDSKRAQVLVLEDETTRGQRLTVTSRKSALVEGPTAADAALAAAPVTVGARASAALPTAMSADGDVVNAWADRYGAQIVRAPGEVIGWYANGDYAAAQTNTTLKAAPGAGTSLYVTDVWITNDATAAITAKLLDGSGGTNLTGTMKIPASGGIVLNLRTPLKLTAATALCLTTTGTSNFTVAVTGYTAA